MIGDVFLFMFIIGTPIALFQGKISFGGFLIMLGWIAVLLIHAPRHPPDAPMRVQRIARHRATAASFFWGLAAYRAIREGSLRPILRHAEWRALWRATR